MTNSEARKRMAEVKAELDWAAKAAASVTATHAPLSQPHSPEAHSDPTGALGGSEGVEEIRARIQASLDRDLWHPALDDVRRLLTALDEARAEVAEMSGWLEKHAVIKTLARATAAESTLASVRELADKLGVRKSESWARYLAAKGVTSQALWQGRFEGIEEAANRLRAALTPTTTETDGDES